MVGTWRVLGKGSGFPATEFSADDMDKINKLFRGDLNVDSVEINSLFGFKDGKLLIRDPLNLKDFIVKTSGIISDRQVTLPLLTGNDTFVFDNHAATLSNKILPGARISNYFDVESTSTPANPSANILRVYRRTSDNSLVYRNNAGTEVSMAGGGGGSGEINTASNIGTAGVGIFKSKVSFDLQFKKLNTPATGLLTITDDTVNNEVDLAVAPSAVNDQYLKTVAGAPVWSRPARVMPDDTFYDGRRWGSFLGGALDGDGLLAGLVFTGNLNVDGSSSGNKTRTRTGATDLATAGWQTPLLLTRASQNVKFKARIGNNLSTERFWFGMIDTTNFPHGATPLNTRHGALFGYNETDTNFMIRTNNGSATANSTSTAIVKDINVRTFEIQLHSTPAVSAWIDGTQILNANTVQPPGATNNLMCCCFGQAVGADDSGPSTDWAMITF